VSRKARFQATFALCTTEAEYMAVSEAAKEAIWLRGSYCELCGISSCVTIHCDSQSAICLTKDPMFHERTKHIDSGIILLKMLLLEVVLLKYTRFILVTIPLI
jgi:hypothetical protein